ncbi:MAG: hypothetical protein HN478_20910 [Rhodospirillaceae bacterium]|jgi:hypothetical protein|nr:hypothetical protein [Rhodospirillaceae bacterium]MBT5191973.1 hypothetical protein [Rhodospirillaceae bacterium]MBT5896240.1 hypothetical protein [Rhodospirillaceae bacterium]MBT6429917.1 hypothetical protein [Rhodospirillaceae bacterium]MBT7760252.1 hypothetical protein [Rhodospirillaceae bacterium]
MEALADLPIFPDGMPLEEAQAVLDEQGLSDGLPLVPPTKARLDAMLAGVNAPNKSYGQLLPLFGDLTTAAVAYNCVLAGCERDALAVVLTAAEACLEPTFNLLGILTTTGTPAVVTIVHGVIRQTLGMNTGTNLLGPGNRANATVGRAIALVMRNIGGARAGIGDMATMGQPGKFAFCFPEGDDASFPTLAARRGLDGDTSAVTILGVSGTAEVLPSGGGDTPEAILDPMAAVMPAIGTAASAGRLRDLGEQFFLLPPELAQQIAKHGWDLARIQRHMFDAGIPARAAEDIQPIITGGAGVKMTYLPLWAGGTLSVSRPLRNLGS